MKVSDENNHNLRHKHVSINQKGKYNRIVLQAIRKAFFSSRHTYQVVDCSHQLHIWANKISYLHRFQSPLRILFFIAIESSLLSCKEAPEVTTEALKAVLKAVHDRRHIPRF
jgi:hypothetical protein